MNREQSLREHLVKLLQGGEAHATFEDAVKDFPVHLRGKKPKGAKHSPWEILEHLRIAQWDILEFARNARHVSPDFPSGYWPEKATPPDERAWNTSVAAFRADLTAMVELVRDEATDLHARIPHGSGQTILRQAMLTADHNAYHLGEFILVRRLLGAWE